MNIYVIIGLISLVISFMAFRQVYRPKNVIPKPEHERMKLSYKLKYLTVAYVFSTLSMSMIMVVFEPI